MPHILIVAHRYFKESEISIYMCDGSLGPVQILITLTATTTTIIIKHFPSLQLITTTSLQHGLQNIRNGGHYEL